MKLLNEQNQLTNSIAKILLQNSHSSFYFFVFVVVYISIVFLYIIYRNAIIRLDIIFQEILFKGISMFLTIT
jgi:hypothetical protein